MHFKTKKEKNPNHKILKIKFCWIWNLMGFTGEMYKFGVIREHNEISIHVTFWLGAQ